MARKLMKIYLNEGAKYKGKLLYHAIVRKLKELQVAGVTVIRGIEGYGPENILRTAKLVDLTVSLPIVIDIVEEEDKLKEITPIIKEMITKGLIVILDAEIV